ncbi:MAG: hypothetical protein AB1439_00460 [candidate division FCPU426 bacterium]
MKKEEQCFDRYPAGIVAVSAAQALLIYLAGAGIMARAGLAAAGIYIAFCLWCEYRVLSGSCVHCAYYGKPCAFGRGLLSSWLFKQGDPARFNARQITWAAMVPDLLISLAPLAVGVFFLVTAFSWLLLGLVAALVILAFPVTGLIRSQWACAHCKQRLLGCPAEKLFAGPAKPDAC